MKRSAEENMKCLFRKVLIVQKQEHKLNRSLIRHKSFAEMEVQDGVQYTEEAAKIKKIIWTKPIIVYVTMLLKNFKRQGSYIRIDKVSCLSR